MRRAAGLLVPLALVAGWFVTLRPSSLGGPAAYVVVSGISMQPALQPGALVVARRQSSYDVGDVIVYRVPRGEPGAGTRVIHRVTGGSGDAGYRTRGDNRRAPDRWMPRPRDIEGAKVVAVPGIGRAMLLLGSPLVIGGLLAILVFFAAGEQSVPRRKRARGDAAILAELTRPAAEAVVVAPEPVIVAPVPEVVVAPEPVIVVAPEPEPVVVTAPKPEPVATAPAPPDVVAALSAAPPRRLRSAEDRFLAAGGAIAGSVAAGVLVARGLRRR
jgi:signal peptidase